MASGGATSGRELVALEKELGINVVGFVFSKEGASGVERIRNDGFDRSVFIFDVNDFYKSRGFESTRLWQDGEDRSWVREEYDQAIIDSLSSHGLNPGLICLSGYMLISMKLHNWRPTINVHPADLMITVDGERKYTGDNAVYDAVIGGEPEVRSTIHLVTDPVDGGPIIVRSKALPVPEWTEANVSQVADDLQELMKLECDNPAYLWAVQNFANGDLEVKANKVFYQGKHLPNGYTL